MPIAEPSTLLTDYLLGSLAAWLSARLIRSGQAVNRSAEGLWGAAFGATAVASFLGGTYHGFGPVLGARAASSVWTATTLAMGAASYLMLAATIRASFTGVTARVLLAAAAAKLIIYTGWMLLHDSFFYVILEYGSTLLAVLAMTVLNRFKGDKGCRSYMAAGVAVSVAAAGIQQSGFQVHRHFNHNDLMHVVQMAAVWMLYEGARRLHDADGSR